MTGWSVWIIGTLICSMVMIGKPPFWIGVGLFACGIGLQSCGFVLHCRRRLERERDEARECLREAMQAMTGTVATGNKWPERWRKAAGLKEQ